MLKNLCEQHSTKFLLVSFTDLFGVVRSKLVPVSALEMLTRNGASFAGFAAHFDLTPAHPDIVVHPDPTTFIPLPWKPGVAWITGDLTMAGKLLEQSPRNRLRVQLEQERHRGRVLKTGVEAEFFLLSADGARIGDDQDSYTKPCYDQLALMRSYDVIGEICETIDHLGWQPYQNDHEDANGQFEINWTYSDALTTADRHTFFKFAVKSIAEKHRMKACFMPKPFENLTGSGCHIHCSVWSPSGDNLFVERDERAPLSSTGLHFAAGLLEHAPAICALTNPSVNSYKRLNANSTVSGATWVSQKLSWAGDNRTHAIRVPANDRLEYRIPDGAANPYLLQLAVLAAGMSGIAHRTDPGPAEAPYFSSRFASHALPTSLFDALNHLASDDIARTYLGGALTDAIVNLRTRQWHDYMKSVSEWERSTTLDC
ncbi:type III glutamate--ammonia ligase [Paraburkholderia sp. BL21I4N1]|uniref:type III glutamate--ammonia ligase n=1 Tax=Paraburkholderia sp. BL21I4N1 TaxID=1938801 RepID=UPI000CFBEB11|nr:type III glutamate--ammonia ligase [Paraburkholderia sp. BL21I4N1]PQV52620.1 gamma-glutamylmethylamide synthetase [Paraburkholderia sp. BL21I4N1]